MASKKQQQSRLDAMKPRVKPVDLFSSLKLELSALIVIATAIAFAMCWFLLKFGWSGWIAMPLTLVVALGITYFFSRGITAPLRQMRDVAEAMADGDYTVRVDIDQDVMTRSASWLARSTRWPANSSMPIKCAAT